MYHRRLENEPVELIDIIRIRKLHRKELGKELIISIGDLCFIVTDTDTDIIIILAP